MSPGPRPGGRGVQRLGDEARDAGSERAFAPPAASGSVLAQPRRMRLPSPFRFTWDALVTFFGQGHPTYAAALTFYTILSLPPLLTLLLLLLGSVADTAAVQAAIVQQFTLLLGPAAGEQAATILREAAGTQVSVRLTAVLGIVGVAFGATNAFAQLQGALDRAWRVKLDPKRGDVHNFIARRIFAFGVLIAVAFLLLASLVLSAALAAFGEMLTVWLEGRASAVALRVVNELISLVIITALFAATFRWVPDATTRWRDLLPGAAITALLLTLGKAAIAFYIGSTDPGSAYGAAGSLAVLLVWLYFSSMIALFGAVLTRQWAERRGAGVELDQGAIVDVTTLNDQQREELFGTRDTDEAQRRADADADADAQAKARAGAEEDARAAAEARGS